MAALGPSLLLPAMGIEPWNNLKCGTVEVPESAYDTLREPLLNEISLLELFGLLEATRT